MNDKIVEFISDINLSNYDEFADNSSINSSLTLDMQLSDYDFSWLDIVEEYLPFVNNIIYLDYTNTNSNVVLKSYENKFIKTLLHRLYNFLLRERKKINNVSEDNCRSIKTYLNTIINDENIDIEINIKSKQVNDQKNGESYGLSLSDRIERVLNIIVTLMNSDFMKCLDDLEVINGSIDKTEVLDQELNYKKAYELYCSLDRYMESNNTIDLELVKKNIEEKLTITSYLDYKILCDCFKNKSETNVYRVFLERLIEKMVAESSIDEKNFKKMITKKFEDEYSKKKNREKNIQNTFIKYQDNYNKQVKDALRALKS